MPEPVLDGLSEDIELAAVLERFDARITERGWIFDEDLSDDESALWTYPPSEAEVADEELASVTTVVLMADDGTDAAHVVFVGTADDYEFELDELFDSLEEIEAYRLGDPAPTFD